ncbi:hypothetical protein DYB32_000700 [Aphanomyces invadans]|uniref:Uncharacterized protein n=1 Tax=Aphanomyces invadans TaxID=157072 RepID=A0A418B960_9STRA|nr:hypothetical protein DYB32_000700 [Aphanomyces invadans]
MSVPWPRNRFSYDVISPEAHAFVDKIFASRSDQPLMMKWVNQHKNKATFSKRILVLSNYRLMTLKPPGLGTKLKVSKDLSFLDLLKIQVEQCDSSTTMKYSIDMSDKDKVVEAFRACCDYHLVPFRDDIAAKLKTAMDSSPCIVDFELCILGMVDAATSPRASSDTATALALLRTLQHSCHFHSLRLSNVRMSHAGLQALESVAKAKEHMPTAWSLTALDLSENSKWTKESVTALVSAMKSFPSPLQAGTGIDTFQLINALKRNVSLHRSSFVALDLSYNMLKATTAAALGENPHFVVSQPNHESTPPPLLTLDLSENNLSDGGAHVLADLIAHSPRVRRDVLKLNQCALHDDSVEAIVTALAQCDALSSLHLEDNDGRPRPKSIFAPAARLRLAPGDAFVKLLTKQRHLKAVYLSNSTCAAMQYSIAVLRGVLHSLGTGTSSVEIVDISGNRGGDDVAKCIAAVLPKTQRLRALFWDGNHTTLAGFRLVQDALRHNRSLCVMPVPLQDTRRVRAR